MRILLPSVFSLSCILIDKGFVYKRGCYKFEDEKNSVMSLKYSLVYYIEEYSMSGFIYKIGWNDIMEEMLFVF